MHQSCLFAHLSLALIPAASLSLAAPPPAPTTSRPSDQRFEIGKPRDITFSHRILDVAISPDGKKIAASRMSDYSVELWNVADGKHLRSMGEEVRRGNSVSHPVGNAGSINQLHFLPDSRRLISVACNNPAVLWDTNTGEALRHFNLPEEHAVKMVQSGKRVYIFASALSRDGRLLIIASSNKLFCFDVETKILLRTIDCEFDESFGIALSPDGKSVACGSKNGVLFFYNVKMGTLIRQIKIVGNVRPVVFSQDGKLVAAGTYPKGAFRVWDTTNGALLQEMKIPKGNVEGAALSFDARYLISAAFYGAKAGTEDEGGVVTVWDATTGKLVANLAGNGYAVALSRDGKLAVTTEGSTMHLWTMPACMHAPASAPVTTKLGPDQFRQLNEVRRDLEKANQLTLQNKLPDAQTLLDDVDGRLQHIVDQNQLAADHPSIAPLYKTLDQRRTAIAQRKKGAPNRPTTPPRGNNR